MKFLAFTLPRPHHLQKVPKNGLSMARLVPKIVEFLKGESFRLRVESKENSIIWWGIQGNKVLLSSKGSSQYTL